MSEWRTIDTAPKDESRVLLVHVGFECCIGYYDLEFDKWVTIKAEDYADDDHYEEQVRDTTYLPTHWMPLPAPPHREG